MRATDTAHHAKHHWDVDRVWALARDTRDPVTFFGGGSRTFPTLIDVSDSVSGLAVDLDTLLRRLGERLRTSGDGVGQIVRLADTGG